MSIELMEILGFNLLNIIEMILVFLLLALSLKINLSDDHPSAIFSNILYMTGFSVTISMVYVLYGAADVAITEASIGACVSTVIFLLIFRICFGSVTQNEANYISGKELSSRKMKIKIQFIFIAIMLCLFLVNMPEFGSAASPVNSRINPHYIQNSGKEIGIFAVAASVLASYRGVDTLGETLVILTAGIAVWLILKQEIEECCNE